MRKWLYYIILFLLMPAACNKSIEIDVPSQTPVLVLNAQWQQAQLFNLRLTRSRGINDPLDTGSNLIRTYEIKNAFITIKQNNVVIDTLKYDSLNFRYINKTKKTIIGNTYQVDATVPGFVSVSAASPVNSLMSISSTQLRRAIGYNSYGDLIDQISFSFNDNSSSTDYYLIRIHKSDGNYADCIGTTDTDFEKMIFNSPYTTETCIDGNKLLLSDQNFNGQTKKIIVTVASNQMDITVIPGKTRRPYIELLHITEDYFKYIKSYNDYDISSLNPFAEPTNVYKNVKNGYGFFTAFSMATDTLR